MTIHSSFPRGAKIRIITKQNQVIVAKFKLSDEKNTIVTDKGNFRKRDLRSCNYYKPLPMKDKL